MVQLSSKAAAPCQLTMILGDAGSCMQSFLVNPFADAAELVKGQHVHIWMLRFKDAPIELASKSTNVVEILVNEGRRGDPKYIEACFTWILEWLVALGPESGATKVSEGTVYTAPF